jgi:hypothetical protein
MTITVPTAVSTPVRDEHVHPVEFSHPAPGIPATGLRLTPADHEAAQPCPPVLFHAPTSAAVESASSRRV